MTEPAAPSPGRIFISYRREDSAYPAGWLYDKLVERYGADQVFKDVDSIELGDDFVDMISSAVGSCDVLLALIGEQWTTITDAQGHRRLDDPDDFVRLEIEAALTRNVRVIPILVDEATMPGVDELPPSLARLVRRQALELSPARFDFDTGRLLRVLDRSLVEVRSARDSATASAAPTSATPTAARHPTEPVAPARVEPGPGPGAPAPTEPAASRPPSDTVRPRRRLSTRARIITVAGAGVALVLVGVGVATTSGGESVVFEDDFSGQRSGWYVLSDEDIGSGDYADGTYRIAVEAGHGDSGAAAFPGRGLGTPPPPDLRVAVAARRVPGTDPNMDFGVLCRRRGDEAYLFGVSDDYAKIVKMSSSDPYAVLWDKRLPLDANAMNRLDAECTGDEGGQAVRLAFSVNGQLVEELTDRKDPLPAGSVGLFLGSAKEAQTESVAEFDDVVVTRL